MSVEPNDKFGHVFCMPFENYTFLIIYFYCIFKKYWSMAHCKFKHYQPGTGGSHL
jgi:hypothetical protein